MNVHIKIIEQYVNQTFVALSNNYLEQALHVLTRVRENGAIMLEVTSCIRKAKPRVHVVIKSIIASFECTMH